MVKIGAQLKYFRRQKEWTQKQVADLLHVTPQTISKWELNKSYPDLDQLVALSQLYGKKVDTLLGQSKPSFFDFLTNSQNLRNFYSVPQVKEEKAHDDQN